MIEKILEVKKSIYRISKPSRLPFDTFQTIKITFKYYLNACKIVDVLEVNLVKFGKEVNKHGSKSSN